jgi:alkyl sulfatase BDS1-like metallo-beta-lactamase superfamily hydrolase
VTERKDATRATKDANDRLIEELPFEDRRDFEDAGRGFVAPLPDGGVIRGEDGSEVWNTQRFLFIEEDSPAPNTVNPSLWRQSHLVLPSASAGGQGGSLSERDLEAVAGAGAIPAETYDSLTCSGSLC